MCLSAPSILLLLPRQVRNTIPPTVLFHDLIDLFDYYYLSLNFEIEQKIENERNLSAKVFGQNLKNTYFDYQIFFKLKMFDKMY